MFTNTQMMLAAATLIAVISARFFLWGRARAANFTTSRPLPANVFGWFLANAIAWPGVLVLGLGGPIATLSVPATCLAALLAAGLSGCVGIVALYRGLNPRTLLERGGLGLFQAAAFLALIMTLGIGLVLILEAARYFAVQDALAFLLGSDELSGNPQGFFQLLFGTVAIAILGLAIAIPVGLLTAIYLTEYASPGFRRIFKPVLEILAGIPTVVYGFFALVIIAPAMAALGTTVNHLLALIPGVSDEVLTVRPFNMLGASLVLGVMIIPYMTSLADDILIQTRTAYRNAALALGATQSEAMRLVILPASLSGVIGSILLAVSRAVSETMIVLMAAGSIANVTFNPFDETTTLAAQIVRIMEGDFAFDSASTLSAFAFGLSLFLLTLLANLAALTLIRRSRHGVV